MIALTFLVALQVGQWTTIPPLNVPRQEVGVAAVEGRVYVIGGIGTDQQGSKVVEIFDSRPDGGDWGHHFQFRYIIPTWLRSDRRSMLPGVILIRVSRLWRRCSSSIPTQSCGLAKRICGGRALLEPQSNMPDVKTHRSLGNHNDPGHAD